MPLPSTTLIAMLSAPAPVLSRLAAKLPVGKKPEQVAVAMKLSVVAPNTGTTATASTNSKGKMTRTKGVMRDIDEAPFMAWENVMSQL